MAYDAFISYSHSVDGRVAPAVRDGLQKLAKPWNKRRALSVFLDQASLEASSGLRTSLVEKLDDAEFLVLLATPESAESPWVNEEITHWLDSRDGAGRIRLVLTGGTLDWNEEEPILDPLNRQSRHAGEFLRIVEKVLEDCPEADNRLEAHYALVKRAAADPTHRIQAMISSMLSLIHI